jgi:REP element-mobilizing transposase RayT
MTSENYHIGDQHEVYFLTFTMTDWVDVFTRIEYKYVITDALAYCQTHKKLKIYAWVLMSNHLHIICRTEEPQRISDWIRDFKQYTAKRILALIKEINESRRDWLLYRFEYAGKFDNRIKNYRFWQDKSHPVLMDDSIKLQQRINYIHNNPVKAGIVANPEDYLFSSASAFAGLDSIINVEPM